MKFTRGTLLERMSYLGGKLRHKVSTEIKESLNLAQSKNQMKKWKGEECSCVDTTWLRLGSLTRK